MSTVAYSSTRYHTHCILEHPAQETIVQKVLKSDEKYILYFSTGYLPDSGSLILQYLLSLCKNGS